MAGAVPGLFEYEGPADLLGLLREALHWVRDPLQARSILAAGRVRRVRADGDTVHVVLALAPGPLQRVTLEDAQAELFDHVQGRWKVRVTLDGEEGGQTRRFVGGR